MGSRQRRRHESGAMMVELAFLIPVFTLMLVGIIDVGRLFYYGIVVSNAARTGAQYGVQMGKDGDVAGMKNAAVQDASSSISNFTSSNVPTATRFCQCPDGSGISCTSGTCTGYGAPKVYVQVNTQYQFSFLFNYGFAPVTLTGQAILRSR